MYDDYIQPQKFKTSQFYQVEQIEKSLKPYNSSNGELMRYTFQASAQNTDYERKAFSVIDVFTIIGGIYKSMTIFGFLCCAAFSYDLFISSLIRQLFHFKPRFKNEF